MTDLFPTLAVPTELEVPRFRFWGDKRPPKNRAEMFSVRTAPVAAAASTAGADSGSAVTGSIATLRIYGPIDSWGGWWGISAKDVATALDALPDDVVEVRVRINSPGGEVWEGVTILNMLRAHKARAVAVVDGLAASAASLIAVGCDETVMSPGTQMMIHDASAFAYGPAAIMTKAARFLDSVSNAAASIYSEAAGGTDAGWRAVMVEETWYTAQEAVDANLAGRVAVVADAGETSTAGDEPDPEVIVVLPEGEDPEDRFDLSIYTHAGRSQAPAPKPPTASADGSTITEGGSAVAFSDEQMTNLRKTLGLAESADEAAITAAVNAVVEESLEERPTATTPHIPDGMSLVDSTVLEQLQAGATAGQTAQKTLAAQERDRVIAQALRDGKIAATSREKLVEAWDKDPESTRAILDTLTPGLVPTNEIGHEDEPKGLGEDIQIDDAELQAFASSFGLTKEDLRG